MGFSVSQLSKIERGTTQINIQRLFQLCELFNITKGSILDGTSSTDNTYLEKEFSDLLKDCSYKTKNLIYDIAQRIKQEEKK